MPGERRGQYSASLPVERSGGEGHLCVFAGQLQSKLPRAPREGLFLPFKSVCARARYLALGFLLPAAGQCASVLALAGSGRRARGGEANCCVRPCPPQPFPKVAPQALLLGLGLHLGATRCAASHAITVLYYEPWRRR